MDDTKRLENLGKLVNNMQSLEMLLRACLFVDELSNGISEQLEKVEFVKGEILPKNGYTNWDSLRKLIRKYNRLPISRGFEIDDTLVDIRDAIAHGRVFSLSESGSNQLVRFRKPKGNEVEIEFSVWMTEEWVGKQNDLFYEAVLKVDGVHQKQRVSIQERS